MITLKWIAEADITQLDGLLKNIEASVDLEVYAQLRISILKKDITELNKVRGQLLQESKISSDIKMMLSGVTLLDVDSVENMFPHKLFSEMVLEAESYFLSGLYCEFLGERDRSIRCFSRAALLFEKQGCSKRSNEAMESALRLQNRIDEEISRRIEAEEVAPSWAHEYGNQEFTRLEKKVIESLRNKQMTKFEVIDHIYGKEVPFRQADNRLKNLLNRVRKKVGNTLTLTNGRYQIHPKTDIAVANATVHSNVVHAQAAQVG
jgi:hypothetical protein